MSNTVYAMSVAYSYWTRVRHGYDVSNSVSALFTNKWIFWDCFIHLIYHYLCWDHHDYICEMLCENFSQKRFSTKDGIMLCPELGMVR